MRAVNLIPADAKRGSRGPSASKGLPTYLFLGVLAIAVGLVTLYVLASNNISQRQAKVTTLQAEVAQVEAQSTSLNHYAQFSQMTQSRIGSVRQLATGRFDWHSTLTQIAQVVPKNTSLATLAGTAASADPIAAASATPTATPTGTSIQLTGCTKSQPDVAKLMSRLRLINGVAGVTLNSSTKQESGPTSPSTPAAPSGSSAASGGGGCGNGTPSFDLQISFATSAAPATPATPAASGAATSTSSATPTSAAPSASGGAS
jgi:Tfp pilus assembly protein PilN